MKRGDVAIVVVPGDYGKPRPAVVVQTDRMNSAHDSIVVCLFSTLLVDAPLFRLPIHPTAENNIELPSQIMIDKIMAVRRDRVRMVIGHLSEADIVELDRGLAFVLGLSR